MRQKEERERERERETKRERERARERESERDRQTDRQRDRERQKDKDRDRERQADRNTERETDRDRDQSVASSPWVLCSSVSSTLSGGTEALSETPPSLHPQCQTPQPHQHSLLSHLSVMHNNSNLGWNYRLHTTIFIQDKPADYIQQHSGQTCLLYTRKVREQVITE